MFRGVITLLAVLVTSISCASKQLTVQEQVNSGLMDFVIMTEHSDGLTFCGTVARSWVPTDLLGKKTLPGILAHETVHREDAESFSSCAEYWHWNTGVNKLRSEALATCVQIAVDLVHGVWEDVNVALVAYANAWVKDDWGFELTPDTMAELIGVSCNIPEVQERYRSRL